ncbi:hypothetical protein FACS1894111_07020 [Clostridia bacterium]|nr:hypothetical protein FACS1894111_07020 [Clostridia bacterium]
MDLICFKDEVMEVGKEIQKFDFYEWCQVIHEIPLRLVTNQHRRYMMFKALRTLFSVLPFGVFKYKSGSFKTLLLHMVKRVDYDLIYCDHLQLFLYVNMINKQKRTSIPIVLQEHNCEYVIVKRSIQTTTSLLKKLFLFIEYQKLQRFEKCAIEMADRVVILSKEDRRAMCKLTHKDIDFRMIPIGIEDSSFRKENRPINSTIKILLMGTWSWEPNRHGLIWFLQTVVPLLITKKMKFDMDIIGGGIGKDILKLSDQYQNVNVKGFVNDIDEYFEKCDCLAVPLFIGSGQRMKIIEAFSKEMPVISTGIGAEGLLYTNNRNILIANSAEDFLEAFEKIKNDELRVKIIQNAKQTFDENHSYRIIAKLIAEAVRFE